MVKKGDISKFFNPKSVAIIGASENINKIGGILVSKAIKSNVKVIPVNPKYDSILLTKCYKSVLDYKKNIDLAVIAIPAEFVLNSLIECGKKGIKNVIIITAGFSELGNKSAEKSIMKAAKKYNIRFIGTNCFGICNPHLNLDLTFSLSMPKKGDIAFISQSGALWSYISDLSADIDLGFSSFVSLGNMDDLSFNDFIKYFSQDKNTKSIVLYIEKLKDGSDFIKMCKKSKKKIFSIKGGSSIIGAKAEFSHTASLASDYAIYKAAFKQAGVVLCDSLESAFQKASGKEIINFSDNKIQIGKRLFILTNAGGAGVLLSDSLSNKGFEITEKPLDILGTATSNDYKNAFDFVNNKEFDSLLVVVTPQSMTDMEDIAKNIIEFQKTTKKKIIALFLGGKEVRIVNEILKKNNISYFNTIEQATSSLEI